MILKTVVFDHTNANWYARSEWNMALIYNILAHVQDILLHRGYIYLNQIYELLGIKWNPDDENPCIKYGADSTKLPIDFETEDLGNGAILVHIRID